MLNILTDLVFGELREYLEDGTESFLWRILMGKKKKTTSTMLEVKEVLCIT